MAVEPRFTHTTRFHNASIEVKSLECGSPADPAGFHHEYEASRISLVRSGLFGRVVGGASLLADSSRALFVNRGDVHARRQREIVNQVRLELFRRLSCPPTLTELARLVDCSAFHLSRLFTAHVGMPMRSYLVRLRVGEAARRVMEGADDFAALALELGFYDHSHFTNAFVAVWGVTPSLFRASRRFATALEV